MTKRRQKAIDVKRLRAFESETDFGPVANEAAIDPPPVIGADERRFQRRAHDDWTAALRGRAWPCQEDLAAGSLEVPHMLLLDIDDPADPAIARIGFALRARSGGGALSRVSDAGEGSMLARLAGHYRHVLATGEPLAFEGEEADGGDRLCYRGLLLPLSCDGRRVDTIYGLLSWRERLDRRAADAIAREVARPAAAAIVVEADLIWDRQPHHA